MPVGRVDYFYLGPMTFSEFLAATGSEDLWTSAADISRLTQTDHVQLYDKFKEFLFVGGMPEAILAFKEDGISSVSAVHRSIVLTYRDDFPKYSKRFSVEHVAEAFNYCGMNAGLRIVYSKALPELGSRSMKKAIGLLAMAKIVLPVYLSPGHLFPLQGHRVEKVFKSYFLDVGLANSIRKIKWRHISSLDNSKLSTLGFMVEQFVAQHLYYQDKGSDEPHLEYWLREGKMRNAEVDFLVEQDLKVTPIEVKAKKSGALRSLHQFAFEHKVEKALRLNLSIPAKETIETEISNNEGRHKVKYSLESLPVYLVEALIDRLQMEE